MKYTAEQIKQHRAEWVAALRSGKYKQTKSRLRTPEGYCCLGVATELAGLTGTFDEKDQSYRYGEDREDAGLPREARAWLGVSNALPTSTLSSEQGDPVSYTVLNDGRGGLAFSEIADHFEQYGFHPSIDALAQEVNS